MKECTMAPMVRGPNDVDPLELVKTTAATYAAVEDGYRAQLYAVLADAFHCYLLFRDDPDDFEELLEDPFWDISRKKPNKYLTTSRFVLYYIMQAETINERARASKFTKILDGFYAEGVTVDQVPARLVYLGGIEAAYVYFKRKLTRAESDDGGAEKARPPTLRKGMLKASGDAEVRSKEIDVESESPDDAGRDPPVGGSLLWSFDPWRDLLVELDPVLLERIVDAGTKHGRPINFDLQVRVYPRDEKGFARVVGRLKP
jgi:hypothetical protein